jgi:hypothetical protein
MVETVDDELAVVPAGLDEPGGEYPGGGGEAFPEDVPELEDVLEEGEGLEVEVVLEEEVGLELEVVPEAVDPGVEVPGVDDCPPGVEPLAWTLEPLRLVRPSRISLLDPWATFPNSDPYELETMQQPGVAVPMMLFEK